MTDDKFKGITTTELQKEIDRRIEQEKITAASERKQREVRIDCPSCDGSGRIASGDTMRIASGECDPYITCPMCQGFGQITAYKVKQ